MKQLAGLLFLLAVCLNSFSQSNNGSDSSFNLENALEQQAEIIDNSESEEDAYFQELQQLRQSPVNLNTANADELRSLKNLSPVQIQCLIEYRKLVGSIVRLYELQSIPYWDINTIQQIMPFVSIDLPVRLKKTFKERFANGEHSIRIRCAQVIEQSKGYTINKDLSGNYYAGSPQSVSLKYKYQYKNLLEYGFLADKDAGETFFKGTNNKGFDFYSAHVIIRNVGIIQSLVLGDFTVNMGQGLVQWQAMAFNKGVDFFAIKRSSPVFKPYQSFGENNFHRGAGCTLGNKKTALSFFCSFRKLDANLNSDTPHFEQQQITSLQTSGLHRTSGELCDRAVQQQFSFGGSIKCFFKNASISFNGIQYQFKLPFFNDLQPYRKYYFSGDSRGNYSFDYSYTHRNMHFYGEFAMGSNQALATVNGLFISVASKADLSFIYRNSAPRYQSLNTNAFSENNIPNNERGFFAGISIRPVNQIKIDGYVDIYKFPWLKYGINAPSGGISYLLQLTYSYNKKTIFYSRYKTESKAMNDTESEFPVFSTILKSCRSWRTQVSYKINSAFSFRNRVEVIWYDPGGKKKEQGFLLASDFFYKPIKNLQFALK